LSIGLSERKIKEISQTIKELIETTKNGNI